MKTAALLTVLVVALTSGCVQNGPIPQSTPTVTIADLNGFVEDGRTLLVALRDEATAKGDTDKATQYATYIGALDGISAVVNNDPTKIESAVLSLSGVIKDPIARAGVEIAARRLLHIVFPQTADAT